LTYFFIPQGRIFSLLATKGAVHCSSDQ